MDFNLKEFLHNLKVGLNEKTGRVYHGTKFQSEIMKEGFKVGKGGNYGPAALYATPVKEIAEIYSRNPRGGTAAQNRTKLHTPSKVFQGTLPYGLNLFDAYDHKAYDKIPQAKSKEQFVNILDMLGYDGIKSYPKNGLKEVTIFNPKYANQAMGVGGQRSVPRAPKGATGQVAFEVIAKPIVEAMLKTIGKPGQSNMSMLGIKPRSN